MFQRTVRTRHIPPRLAELGEEYLEDCAELLTEAVSIEDCLYLEVMDWSVDVDEVGLVWVSRNYSLGRSPG